MTHKTLLLSLCLWTGMALISPRSEAADASLTIESVMSAPFPYGLAASPKGERVAKIVNHLRARNIWLGQVEASGKIAQRAVTQLEDDNSIELADLQWSSDSKRLAWIRVPSNALAPLTDAFFARRKGEPWSIWVGDVSGGT